MGSKPKFGAAHSRRRFLAAGAVFGTWLGFGKARAAPGGALDLFPGASPQTPSELQLQTLADVFERPGTVNTGPVFLRKTFDRPQPTGRLPILQGATSQTQTQFRVLVETNISVRYYVSEVLSGGVSGGTPGSVRRSISPRARNGVPTSQAVIDHLYVEGLSAGTLYWLEIEIGGAQPFVERRKFSTMAARNLAGDPLRVALISCQNDRYVAEQSSMWEAVSKSSPELLIFNGDSCYVDQRANGTVEGMWSRHVTTRTMLDVFKWDRLVPVLATWDDHDTGENDSNSFNPFQKVARENFVAMFGSDPVDGFRRSSELCYSFTTHGQRFVFLDCRSDKRSDRVFSLTDEAWLANEVATSPGPVWLINGMQFWGGYLLGAESVEATSPDQLYRIMKIGAAASVPLVLCSGDVHFSEIMEIEKELMGYRTFEITSSALHSRTFPGQQYRSYNGRRLESTSKNNFIALETRATSVSSVEFEAVSLGAFEKEYFRWTGDVRR